MADALGKIKEFLATKKGKTIAAASAGGLLVAIVLIAVAVFFIFDSGVEDELSPLTPGKAPVSAQAPASGEKETATEEKQPPINESYEAYEYKDPFQPLFVEEETTEAVVQDKNIVLDITTDQNGVRYATVRYNGQTYDVREGDILGRSAYKVLVIEAGSVVFLYGDNQVRVEIGEELSERIGGVAGK